MSALGAISGAVSHRWEDFSRYIGLPIDVDKQGDSDKHMYIWRILQ